MKKLVFLGKSLLLLAFGAVAQETPDKYIAKPRMSIGAEFLIPSNRGFGELFSVGYGFSGKFEVPVTNKFYGTLTAGFTKFVLKAKYESMTFNKTYIPMRAGAKYYLHKRFYTEAELGASVGTNKGAGTAFAWSGGTGLSIPVTEDGYLDAGIRYEKWARDGGNIGQVGFRVAYKF